MFIVEALSLDIKMVEPDMEVLEDASYEIECIVSPTKRRLNLKWMFGDKVLHNSSEFQVRGNAALYIQGSVGSYNMVIKDREVAPAITSFKHYLRL